MQAVILAGGLGTRLSAVLPDTPKVLAPIDGKPFLHYQLTLLNKFGVKRVLMLTGHQGDKVEATFSNGFSYGFDINYIKEEYPLGTGGALLNAFNLLDDQFLLVNGDTFFDIDLDILESFFNVNELPGLMALRFTERTDRYGLVSIDPNYRVCNFLEKKELNSDRADGYINGGIYILRKAHLAKYIAPVIKTMSLEKTVLPDLTKEGNLFGLPVGGKFIDIGVPEDYRLAQEEIPKWIKLKKRPCLFLDRDGVLIQDTGYVHGFDLKFIPETMELVREANRKGEWVIVITNQAGVARGFFDETQIKATNSFIKSKLEADGLRIDDFFYCPYHPEGAIQQYKKHSLARKPGPGMLLKASETYPIDFQNSIMIGDKESDRVRLPYLYFKLFSHKFSTKLQTLGSKNDPKKDITND